MRCRAWSTPQAHGYRVDAGRRERALQALAGMYLDYPRAEPELKAYVVWVIGRALGDRAEVQVFRDGESRTYAQRGRARRGVERPRADAAVRPGPADAGPGRGQRRPRRRGRQAADRVGAAPKGRWRTGRATATRSSCYDGDTGVEATAWAVRAIAARMPDSALLEPAVRWLMLNRRAGWWSTTKQSAIALDGVLTYMRARRDTGAVGPVEVVRQRPIWPARTPSRRESLVESTPVEIAAPAAEGANAVRIVARGTGIVHWSAIAEYFDPTAARIDRARASWRSPAAYAKLESTRPRRAASSTARCRSPVRCRPATSSPCGSPWPAAATGATC